ncbi:MAG: hypothetical protein GY738_20375, partial [Pseudoalteromonas sp.]|nr:hypothetical protein [Pseudoalteromonas sp.]
YMISLIKAKTPEATAKLSALLATKNIPVQGEPPLTNPQGSGPPVNTPPAIGNAPQPGPSQAGVNEPTEPPINDVVGQLASLCPSPAYNNEKQANKKRKNNGGKEIQIVRDEFTPWKNLGETFNTECVRLADFFADSFKHHRTLIEERDQATDDCLNSIMSKLKVIENKKCENDDLKSQINSIEATVQNIAQDNAKAIESFTNFAEKWVELTNDVLNKNVASSQSQFKQMQQAISGLLQDVKLIKEKLPDEEEVTSQPVTPRPKSAKPNTGPQLPPPKQTKTMPKPPVADATPPLPNVKGRAHQKRKSSSKSTVDQSPKIVHKESSQMSTTPVPTRP